MSKKKKLLIQKVTKFVFKLLAYEIFIFGFCVLLMAFLLVMGYLSNNLVEKDKGLLNVRGRMMCEANTTKQGVEEIPPHPIRFPYPLNLPSVEAFTSVCG